MPNTSRNFVVAYILLVGLPLLGLAGVLRSGRNLVAPISIDGTWKVEGDASRISNQPCARTISSLVNTSLVISQSGKSLALTFNNPSKTVASGSLEGKSLRASIGPQRDSAGEMGCGGDQIPTLTAAVDPKSEPRTLTGSLSVSGCASCASVEFRAVRQPRPAAGGGH
jgi:hypothetical protein